MDRADAKEPHAPRRAIEGSDLTPNDRSRSRGVVRRLRPASADRTATIPDPVLVRLLRTTAEAARVAAGAESVVAVLYVSEGRQGSLVSEQAGRKLPVPVGVLRALAEAVRTGSSVCWPGAAQRSLGPAVATRAGIRALAAVHLQVGGLRGCLLAVNPPAGAFSPTDIGRLDGVAHCARLAVGEALETIDAERRRLARELHDTFGQTLTCLIFAVDELEGAMWSTDQRLLARVVRSHALKAVRLSRELVDSTLAAQRRDRDRGGKMADLFRDLERKGLAVRFGAETDLSSLPAETRGCLYGIAREALVNVARHASASGVEVLLARRGTGVELTIADDGKGFCEQDLARGGWGGFGVRMMRERVEESGGTFLLESALGQGTRITARLPLPACRRPAIAE